VIRDRYRFGDIRIDLPARELRRGGESVPVSPMVFDCIAYLLTHRDRAVGRDELIAAVWGKVDVAYSLLGQIIVKARRALGDNGDEQTFIRTVPRFGFRWVAEPSTGVEDGGPIDVAVSRLPGGVGDPAPVAAEDGNHVASASRGHIRRSAPVLTIVVMAFVLAIAALAHTLYTRKNDADAGTASSDDSVAAPSMVAVMPVGVVADGQWSWVRLGVMDLMTNRLRDAGFSTVPSDNIVALSRSVVGVDASTVASILAARSIVNVSATLTGDGWRIDARVQTGQDALHVDALDADVIAAAHRATDRLLSALGRGAPASRSIDHRVDAWISRAQAAFLSDDFAAARTLLDAAPPDIGQSPEIQLRLAEIDERSADFDAARTRLEQLLERIRPDTQPAIEARALAGLGRVALRRHDPSRASRHFDDAIALMDADEASADLGRAYIGRGVTRAVLGDYDGAGAAFGQARVALELAGDSLSLARVESNEGLLEVRRNHHAVALPILERAARRFEQFGLPNELPIALGAQIDIQLALLQSAKALAVQDELPMSGQDVATPPQQFLAYQQARALLANGRLAHARDLLRLLAAAGDAGSYADHVRLLQAHLAMADGDVAVAADLSRQVADALEGPEHVRDGADAWLLQVRALRALDRAMDAERAIAKFQAWATSHGNPTVDVYVGIARAEHAWAQGASDEARAAYDASLSLAIGEGVPVDIAAVVLSHGSRLLDAGRFDQARPLIGRIGRWSTTDFACAVLQARLYYALGQTGPWESAFETARALAGERELPAGLGAAPRS
jgi:DNA-binding winged helix-turn-helix (wHTH) protein/tetratricopeptide (TPR) repeat protein